MKQRHYAQYKLYRFTKQQFNFNVKINLFVISICNKKMIKITKFNVPPLSLQRSQLSLIHKLIN